VECGVRGRALVAPSALSILAVGPEAKDQLETAGQQTEPPQLVTSFVMADTMMSRVRH